MDLLWQADEPCPSERLLCFAQHHRHGLRCRESAGCLLGVEAVPALAGSAYGPQGDGYERISYANSLDGVP